MKTGKKGISLIRGFESLHDGDMSLIGLQPKLDPIGIWTEGYGHAMIDPKTNKFLKGEENEAYAQKIAFINDVNIDDEIEAERLLASDLKSREEDLNDLGLKLNQFQFDACISFIFNLGIGNFKSSTLLKKIRRNPKDPEIRGEFMKWVRAGGRTLNGLIRRREAEAKLYFTNYIKQG